MQSGRVTLDIWIQLLEQLANRETDFLGQLELEDATEDALAWAEVSQ